MSRQIATNFANTNRIKTKNGYTLVGLAIMIIVVAVILILVVALFGGGIAAWWNYRGEVSPNIDCATWAGAPDGYQDKITAAANKAGIQPALLGAIFLSENGDVWGNKPTTSTNWDNWDGPFQMISVDWPDAFKAGFNYNNLTLEQAIAQRNNFDISALGAAFKLKYNFDYKGIGLPDNSSDQKAIMFAGLAYNAGVPTAGIQWAQGGYDITTPPKATYPYWGNNVGSARTYATRAWDNFKKLNVDCAGFTPSSGASYIQACQGGTTTSSSGSVIVIDPGHGTPNNHAGAQGEPGVVLEVGLAVTKQLRAKGYTVYMTRGDPNGGGIDTSAAPGNNDQQTDEDNKRRALFANSKGATLIFRIHADSSGASTPHQGYYFTYPTYPGSSRDGHAGPSQDTAQKSEAIAKALSAFMATGQGLTKHSDPKSDTAGTQYGRNLVGSSWSTVPGALIEMFDMTSSNATSSGYKAKMEVGITNAIASAVPLGNGGQVQTTTMTKTCQLANLALETAKDIKAHECPKGDGCANNSGKYYSSNNGYSQYASNYVQGGSPITWGGRGVSGFTSCARFVGTLVRKLYDRGYPLETSSDQWDYVIRHRDKYDIKSFVSSEAQPGDIVFRGSCNIANSIPGAQTLESLEACFGRKNGVGHTEIYTGTNDAFPNSIAIGASLGGWGPSPRSGISGDMGLRARLKN